MSGEYYLDRLVFFVLGSNRKAARELVAQALTHTAPGQEVFTQLLWPALTCVEKLHVEGCLTRSVYNAALHTIEILAHHILSQLPLVEAGEGEAGRSMLVASGLGEKEEMGAKITAGLAEAKGWRVHFGGAGLSDEELTFALGRLSPEVLVLHVGAGTALGMTRQLIGRLHRVKIWPVVQIGVVGAGVEHPSCAGALGADLAGRDPVELLEMLELCPEKRAREESAVSEDLRHLRRWHVN